MNFKKPRYLSIEFPEDKAKIVRVANDIPKLPRISVSSTREELQAWLHACDPNGVHTDDAFSRDGEFRIYVPCEPCTADDLCPRCKGTGRMLMAQRAYETVEDAWDAVAELLADDLGIDPDAQCPEHGCARHHCDEEHDTYCNPDRCAWGRT